MQTSAQRLSTLLQQRSETLLQTNEAVQRRLDEQTNELLRQHHGSLQKQASTLLKHSDVELNTTKRAIAALRKSAVHSVAAGTRTMKLQLETLHADVPRRLRRLLFVPIVISLVGCVAMLAGAGLASWAILTKAKSEADEIRARADLAEQRFCLQTPAGRAVCKTRPAQP